MIGVAGGAPPPPAGAGPDRAGVAARLVSHLFEDMDALYGMAAQPKEARHWRDLQQIPAGLPLDQRVDRTVQQRAKLFEAIGPLRHALLPVVPRNAVVADTVATEEQRLRQGLETTFAADLRRAGRARRELLDALDAASSWEAWARLRRGQGLGTTAARKVMARTMTSLVTR